jgi:hypothetical protein
MDIILFGHRKILLLGIWPSSSCTYLFPLGQIPIIHSRISRKQLTRFYQSNFSRYKFSSGYHRAIRQSKRRSVGMLRGIHAFEKKGWDRLFWVGLRSACGEVTVLGAYFRGFFPSSFPVFFRVRVAIYTSTSPRFCVFYICMNTFNTVRI